MSHIDELIAQHCPDGVRHVALSEVAEYSPTRIDAVALDGTSFVGVDNLVADKGGRTDASYLPNTTRLTAYEPGDILLGNIRPYLKKVWLATNSGGCSGDVLAIRIKPEIQESLASEFLYYLLSSDDFFAYNMQHAKGAKMPRGSKAAILNYVIPVPPLEVQRAIVEVLDTFSKLEAELEAELEARKQQYEHYRAELLVVPEAASWTTLGELCKIETGKLNANAAVNDGEYAFFTTAQEISRIDRYRWDTEALLVAGNANVGDVKHYIGKFDAYQRTYVLTQFSELVDVRFLYYVLKNGLQRYLEGRTNSAAMTYIVLGTLRDLPVPIMPSAEQRRIVEVLDKFDALVNDLSVGLPAELAARRQQYEYYRDRLLTFEELPA